MADSLDELRQKVAVAMRILALQKCVTDIMGHVSGRIPGTSDMFIRCRGGNERGLIYTNIQQIRRIKFTEKAALGSTIIWCRSKCRFTARFTKHGQM